MKNEYNLEEFFKKFLAHNGLTLNRLVQKYEMEWGKVKGMSYNNLNESLKDNTITFRQIENLLNAMDYHILFKPNHPDIDYRANWFDL